MHDLKQFSYWQERRLTSSHWYNIYNPVISVELTELADRVAGNNDGSDLDLTVQQNRVPTWNESLLMSMSDALLRSLQRWITDHGCPMRTLCYVLLQAVEQLPLPITRCLGVLTNIPVFTFFPWTVSLTKALLAMFDWLSQKWLMTQLQTPCMQFKLVITLIHHDNRA